MLWLITITGLQFSCIWILYFERSVLFLYLITQGLILLFCLLNSSLFRFIWKVRSRDLCTHKSLRFSCNWQITSPLEILYHLFIPLFIHSFIHPFTYRKPTFTLKSKQRIYFLTYLTRLCNLQSSATLLIKYWTN